MKSFLEIMQEDIERYLNKQEVLKEIPVMSHRQSSIPACLNELVACGAGISVVVMNPIPTRIIATDKGLAFEGMNIRVRIIETPLVEEPSASSLAIAEFVSQMLDYYKPTIPCWEGWLEIDNKFPFKEIKDNDKAGRYIIELNFNAVGSVCEEEVCYGNFN